ncbi:unnamed protein product [Dicrocoelium dendriticum]|nr:unnamed protein product [Dicrocoelium dendriticum]
MATKHSFCHYGRFVLLVGFLCLNVRQPEVDASAVLDVYLRAVSWNSILPSHKFRVNVMVLADSPEDLLHTWTFVAHGTHTPNGTLVIFTEFLNETHKNPVFVKTNYSKLDTPKANSLRQVKLDFSQRFDFVSFSPNLLMSSRHRDTEGRRMVTTNPKRNSAHAAGLSSDRVAHRPQTLSTGGRKYEMASDWKPMRRSLTSHNPVESDAFEEESYPAQLQSDINQELTDLLRSQIARLLEENEKILTTMDDYREQLTNLRREQKESNIDPSSEMMALQTALGESRLREAELTIALGELQDRIAAIDRMIEMDPEMESFFNAVTISTTALSKTQPIQRTSQNQSEPCMTREQGHVKSAHRSATQVYKSGHPTGTTCSDRRSSAKMGKYPCAQVGRCSSQVSADTDTPELSHRSGLESPQSDSGCSLNSHTPSDATDPINSFDEPESMKTRNQVYAINDSLENEPYLEHGFAEDRAFQNPYPRKVVTLLRRSRSSATEQAHTSGFYGELNSPVSALSKDNIALCDRNFDDAPTPTEDRHTLDHVDSMGTIQSDIKWTTGDRFSKLRASFRRSFGLGPAKPDFRIEAFAARQGEARALLSLRETRMELLRVQSRCQTLQRHMERLEAINVSRMEELEASAIGDRELRQDIRELQRRIFQLEAEVGNMEYILSTNILNATPNIIHLDVPSIRRKKSSSDVII